MCDGAVFSLAAVIMSGLFLQALCGCLYWYFAAFLYFVLLDGFLITDQFGFKIFLMYFFFAFAASKMKIRCSLLLSADQRPHFTSCWVRAGISR